MSDRLNEVITIFQSVIFEKIIACQKIPNSITNENYLIETDANKYVIRMPLVATATYIDRINEKKVLELVRKWDLKTIYFSATSGIKITKYESNEDFILTDYLLEIATAIKRMHRIRSKKLADIKTFDFLDSYNKMKSATKEILKSQILYEKELLLLAEQELDSSKKVLSHNDLVRGNILLINNKIRIIDYEYASLNHPFFDLLSFITENNIDDSQQQEIFFKAYFGKKYNKKMAKRLKIWALLLDLYWYHWAIDIFHKTQNITFNEIAMQKYNRYNLNIKSIFCH